MTRPHVTWVRAALRWVFRLAALIAIGLAFWPARVGGLMSYTVVSGQSMEPTFHTGDLVLAHRWVPPSPGRVVVYEIPGGQVGGGLLVVHRVRERRPDGSFAIRGDNERSDDAWHIGGEDIGGGKLLLVPKGAYLLALLRSTWAQAAFAAILVARLAWPRQGLEDSLDVVWYHKAPGWTAPAPGTRQSR